MIKNINPKVTSQISLEVIPIVNENGLNYLSKL